MKHGSVLLSVDGPLATVTLHRPEVLNALNFALLEDLEAAMDAVVSAPDVRVVLVRGAGRAFSARLDLDMREHGVVLEFLEGQEQIRARLEALDAISIAAVHGYCLGGGLQLAIACDIRVCSNQCSLGLPAVMEGIFPGLATVRLPRLIGLGVARKLVLSGELIEAGEALRLGLVDHLVPGKQFEAGTAEVLQRYLQVPTTAAAASKHLMRRAFEAPLSILATEMLPLLAACLASGDAQAAATAWRQGRAERSRNH